MIDESAAQSGSPSASGQAGGPPQSNGRAVADAAALGIQSAQRGSVVHAEESPSAPVVEGSSQQLDAPQVSPAADSDEAGKHMTARDWEPEAQESQSPMLVPANGLRNSIRSGGLQGDIAAQILQSESPRSRRHTIDPAARVEELQRSVLKSRRQTTGTLASEPALRGERKLRDPYGIHEGPSSPSSSSSSSPQPRGPHSAMVTSHQANMHASLSQLASVLCTLKENFNHAHGDAAGCTSELEALRQEYKAWRSESERLSAMAEDMQKQLRARAHGSPRRATREHGSPGQRR